MEEPYSRIYARIDLDAVAENMEAMRSGLPEGTKLIGVVKADGYGHGAVPVAKAIAPFVWGYAAATVEEAVTLRHHGIKKPLLVLGPVPERFFPLLLDNEIRPPVFQLSKAEALSKLAVLRGRKAKIHLALDTGMCRIGLSPDQAGLEEAERICRLPGIEAEGLFTHFSRADETDKENTGRQYERYTAFVRGLEAAGISIPIRHVSNSAAIIDLQEMSMDAVRAGIAIYGLYPSGEVSRESVKLRPAMELYSFVTYIKEIEAGSAVSYGGTFVADKRIRLATVSAGYGDGYPRGLSGRGEVLLRGKRAPILGRVCMDQFMVDISGIPEAMEGDRVTLLGRDGDESISMEELAERGGGFHYEIPCVLGKRVPRIYVRDEKMVGRKDYFDDEYRDFMEE